MTKQERNLNIGTDASRVVTPEVLPSRALVIRHDLEAAFNNQIEETLFRSVGVPADGVTKKMLLSTSIQFAQFIEQEYGDEIRSLSREEFAVLTSVFAQDPARVLPERKGRTDERLDVVYARAMARMSLDSRTIGNTFHRDREAISRWTNDIKDDIYESKKQKARELIGKGQSIRFVRQLLSVDASKIKKWCEDLLLLQRESRERRIAQARQLAEQNFWPVDIGRVIGKPRTTTRTYVDDIWKRKWGSKRDVYNAWHKRRIEQINEVLGRARRTGQKVTKSELARVLGVHITTVTRDLEAAGVELDG